MFRIASIECGWFNFILSDQANDCNIRSSKVSGYDTAKALLNATSDIFFKKSEDAKIFFNAENEAHIIQLTSHDDKLEIEVFKITDNPFKYLGEQFSSLDSIKKTSPIMKISCDVTEFAKEICIEFSNFIEHNNISKYENNWFPFPHSEYDQLYSYFKYRI